MTVSNRCRPRSRLSGRRSPIRACEDCGTVAGRECPDGIPPRGHECLHDNARGRACRRRTATTTGMLRHERDYHGASTGVTARPLGRAPYVVFVSGIEVRA